MLGTKAAVECAVSAIYKDTKVSEWFEYGGPPYHFKLLIDATYEDVDPVKHQRVLDRVEYYKNLRSAPYGIEYVAHPEGVCTCYAAAAAAGMAMSVTVGVNVYGLG
jgi:P2-related tail formation protein